MTREDALTVTEYVLNAWAKPDWDDGHAEAFVSGLIAYDAATATEAIVLAHRTIDFRPSFAEFLKFYRAAKAEAEARQQRTPEKPSKNKLPRWVKRWVASRFLHVQFGRPQDMRRFSEQGDWGDPSTPLMPPDEWEKEAAEIGDREAMKAIGSQ